MDLSHLTNPTYPPLVGYATAPEQHGVLRTGDEGPGKRRAVDVDPAGRSASSPASHRSPMSRSSYGRGFEDIQGVARKPNESHEDYIPMILNRLATIERDLGVLRSSPGSSNNARYSPDMASMRLTSSTAMQGRLNPPSNFQTAAFDGPTPIYDDDDRQLEVSFTDSLSLRRNMNSPETPPFGMWWTCTIEETLVWPILKYNGDRNDALDALMDSSDEEDDENQEDESPIVKQSSLGRRVERSKASRLRRGLDNTSMVTEFLDLFLRNVHVKNPILDVSQLRAYAANLIEDGLSFNGETCQVLLVCALGAISHPWDAAQLDTFSGPRTPPERYSIAQAYFDAAQKRLGGLCAHSSLISAQCLFLTGVYFMYCQKSVAGWRAFNSASIACRSYISKRTSRQKKSVPRYESRSLEERLCWSCLKSEREIACQFGMETSGLNLLANSTSLPTPPDGYASDINQPPSNAVQNMTPAPSPNLNVLIEAYEDQSWHYFLTEMMLCKLEVRIGVYSKDKRREAYRRAGEPPGPFFRSMLEALQKFDYELGSYFKNLPPTMEFSLSDLTPCSDELRNNLRWRLLGVKHDITMPAVYILLHNDISHWPKRLVADLIEMTNACLKLDINLLRIAITTHRSQTTWLGIRMGVRSALILIAAGRLAAQHLPGLEKLYVPDRATWEDGSRALAKGLQYWSAECKDGARYLDILQQLDPVFRKFSQPT